MAHARRIAVLAAIAALAVPAVSLADPGTGHGPTPNHGANGHGQAGTSPTNASPTGARPGTPVAPTDSASAKRHAYGVYCQGQSKKHVKGQKGTPFSQCVTAMAKLGSGQTSSPHAACAGLSKKHVKGQKGTPFSQCVSGAAKLRHDAKHAAAKS